MKSHIFFFLLAATAAAIAQPHPDTLWTRTYGGHRFDNAEDIQQTSDGGFIIAGWTYSYGEGSCNWYLVKTNPIGDTLWTRTFGGDQWSQAYAIQQTSDGGYIAAGYTSSFGAVGADVYLVKTDEFGDTLWTRYYEALEGDAAYSVRQTPDGGYIVAGMTPSFGAGENDCYLIRIDSQGNMLWRQVYGGSADDEADEVQLTYDGGFVLVGWTESFGAGLSDGYIVKTDSLGDTLWTHTYGGHDWDYLYSIQQTFDGGYVAVGYTFSFGSSDGDIYIIRINSSGELIWYRLVDSGLHDSGRGVQRTRQGNYVVTGEMGLFGPNDSDFCLIKVNDEGDTLWTRRYGGIDYEWAYAVRQTVDGGYVMAGNTESFGAGEADLYIVKTGPDESMNVPDIELSTPALEFDSVSVGEHAELPMNIYNIGDTTLILYNIFANDSCFTTDFDTLNNLIAPGDSLGITVSFAPLDFREYHANLNIFNNDEFVTVQLHGIGAQPSTVSENPSWQIPKTFSLLPPYPNPFNSATSIIFEIPRTSQVNLAVYNVQGQRVATLVNSFYQPGQYRVLFDAGDIASGVYFVRLDYTGGHQMQKILYLK